MALSDQHDQAITEAWLKEVGFLWHQVSRQPQKHWLLWLGDAVRARDNSLVSWEDIGVEIAGGSYAGADRPDGWFCWFRSDFGREISPVHPPSAPRPAFGGDRDRRGAVRPEVGPSEPPQRVVLQPGDGGAMAPRA